MKKRKPQKSVKPPAKSAPARRKASSGSARTRAGREPGTTSGRKAAGKRKATKAKKAKVAPAVPAPVPARVPKRRQGAVKSDKIPDTPTSRPGQPVKQEPEPRTGVGGASTIQPMRDAPGVIPVVTAPPQAGAVVPKVENAPRPAGLVGGLEKLPVPLPPILLEGDEPTQTHLSGPGKKFVVGSVTSAPGGPAMPAGVLPVTASGAQARLHLTPRDPWCLYAHWELPVEEQMRCNAQAKHHHLVLRVRPQNGDLGETRELHVHPESRHWFVHVDRPGTAFAAELGFYSEAADDWVSLAISTPVATPMDRVSEENQVLFATLPPPVQEPEAFVESAPEPVPIAFAPAERAARVVEPEPEIVAPSFTATELRHAPVPVREEMVAEEMRWGESHAPVFAPVVDSQFEGSTPRQREMTQQLFAEVVRYIRTFPPSLPTSPGGEGVTEAAAQVPAFTIPISFNPEGQPSSPVSAVGAAQPVSSYREGPPGLPGGFWFNVNAELIVYGATEPTAEVAIGGRRIRLRQDGTFSFRFSLPDGDYQLPITAISQDGMEQRFAGLTFRRATEYRGEVGVHPQSGELRPAAPENVA